MAASLGLFIAGLQAQTLDSVLAGETDVSTFYSLIQVCFSCKVTLEQILTAFEQKYPDILNGLPSGGATVWNLIRYLAKNQTDSHRSSLRTMLRSSGMLSS